MLEDPATQLCVEAQLPELLATARKSPPSTTGRIFAEGEAASSHQQKLALVLLNRRPESLYRQHKASASGDDAPPPDLVALMQCAFRAMGAVAQCPGARVQLGRMAADGMAMWR